jgi:hypothetical protein
METVNAALNYLEDPGQKPVSYTYRPPEGVPARSGQYAKFTVPIHDGRAILAQLSLDKQGVILAPQESKVVNFYDSDEVRRVYYPEVERLVKELTGAIKVHVFDHNVRNKAMSKAGEAGVSGPVKVAHNDYTVKSGPQRVRDLLPHEADELLKNRFAVINVWRPIRGPVEENPLAVCDARTIAPKDLVINDLIYRDRVGEVYVLAYNPEHRWFYFPQMEKNEVMLLKCYDSDDHRARFTAHSSFDDPTSPPNAPARESIEVRTLVFFPPEPNRSVP